MANPWREKVLKFNRKRKETDEKASDFEKLMQALPPGQRKQLLKDETCAEILRRHGYAEE